jgi:hypothetical protein
MTILSSYTFPKKQAKNKEKQVKNKKTGQKQKKTGQKQAILRVKKS